jgi:hypothetical protein
MPLKLLPLATPENPAPAPPKTRLVTHGQRVPSRVQHTSPCPDCPWARTSFPGWLGPSDATEWLQHAHADHHILCHSYAGPQCAGAAIYRRNVCKRVDVPLLTLPADKELVFAAPGEFRFHHEPNVPVTRETRFAWGHPELEKPPENNVYTADS